MTKNNKKEADLRANTKFWYRGFSTSAIILIITVLVIGGGVYYMIKSPESGNNSNDKQNESNSSNSLTPPDDNAATRDFSRWNVYKNEKYGFGFLYPKTSKINEVAGGGDILTNIRLDSDVNFQIYKLGSFEQSPIFNLNPNQASKCKIYNRSTRVYDGVSSVEIEYQNCPDGEAASITRRTFVTIAPLEKSDLVVTRYDNPKYEIVDTLDLAKSSRGGERTTTETPPGIEPPK